MVKLLGNKFRIYIKKQHTISMSCVWIFFLRENLDGCHVQKANNPFDSKWYIVPLCDTCNHSNEKLDVGYAPLIPTPSYL